MLLLEHDIAQTAHSLAEQLCPLHRTAIRSQSVPLQAARARTPTHPHTHTHTKRGARADATRGRNGRGGPYPLLRTRFLILWNVNREQVFDDVRCRLKVLRLQHLVRRVRHCCHVSTVPDAVPRRGLRRRGGARPALAPLPTPCWRVLCRYAWDARALPSSARPRAPPCVRTWLKHLMRKSTPWTSTPSSPSEPSAPSACAPADGFDMQVRQPGAAHPSRSLQTSRKGVGRVSLFTAVST